MTLGGNCRAEPEDPLPCRAWIRALLQRLPGSPRLAAARTAFLQTAQGPTQSAPDQRTIFPPFFHSFPHFSWQGWVHGTRRNIPRLERSQQGKPVFRNGLIIDLGTLEWVARPPDSSRLLVESAFLR